MRYLPKSPFRTPEMLAVIGVRSIEDLFKSIPEKFRLREPESAGARFPKRRSLNIFRRARPECSWLHFVSRRGRISASSFGYSGRADPAR